MYERKKHRKARTIVIGGMGASERLQTLAAERAALLAEATGLQQRLTAVQGRIAELTKAAEPKQAKAAQNTKPQKSASTKPKSAPSEGGAAGSDAAVADDKSVQTLKKLGVPHRIFEHPAAGTIADWKPHMDALAPDARLCKNLFLKDKKKGMLVLCTALADTNTDMKFISNRLKAKNPRLAAPEVLNETLGLKKGAVTPLACMADPEKKVMFVLDKAMVDVGKTHELLVHPLSGNHISVALKSDGLLAYFKEAGHEPLILEFPE